MHYQPALFSYHISIVWRKMNSSLNVLYQLPRNLSTFFNYFVLANNNIMLRREKYLFWLSNNLLWYEKLNRKILNTVRMNWKMKNMFIQFLLRITLGILFTLNANNSLLGIPLKIIHQMFEKWSKSRHWSANSKKFRYIISYLQFWFMHESTGVMLKRDESLPHCIRSIFE